jgi:ABC-type branched-subunit amino acid transport system ATPase component/branched-subunit amino acid ABC-type transport system permease component
MHQFLPFIVIGLVSGAAYGLAGMGLVLTYKTSGIFNFAYGAVSTLGTFCFYFFYVHGWPWELCALVTLVLFGPVVGLGLEFLTRSLEDTTETVKVVATVGLILIVEALGLLWHPAQASPPIFPHFLSQSTVKILGVNVTWEQIIILAFAIVAAAAFYWFFASVRIGILMRSVVDNDHLVAMSGYDPAWVRRWAWIIGTVFAMIAGLMLAPGLPVDGITLTTLVFAAFGAAAVGYFSNLPLAFVGGLVIGIGGALTEKYAASISWVEGLAPSLPFIILLLVLIAMPRERLLQRRLSLARSAIRRSYRAPTPVRLTAGTVTIAVLALIPVVQASHLIVWSGAVIYVILFLSLGLLVRGSGQISLCQLAFAAVGAASFAHLSEIHGMPWLVAFILASLVAVPVGAAVAIPAMRLSGVFLALATLGFGVIVEEAFYNRRFMFGSSPAGIADPRPDFSIGGLQLSSDKGFYYLVLVVMVLVVLAVTAISNGRLGRLLEAMGDSPLAFETQGATSNVLKLIVFCIAAVMSSAAGALLGMLYQFSVGADFRSGDSLTLVVLVVIVTVGDPWYALVAAGAYVVIPGYIHGPNVSNYLLLLFGVSAAVAAYTTRGGVMPVSIQRVLDRLGARVGHVGSGGGATAAPALSQDSGSKATPAAGTSARQPAGDGLVVSDLSVRFGGVQAVNRVSLKAPAGRITGLIGPNGAGKTTTFNACNGLNRPSSGEISLHGVEVGALNAPQRARRGLGRTFQRPELFKTLTARQNVSMGVEAAMAGANPLTQVFGSRRANRLISDKANEALVVTGTQGFADAQVGLLSIGQQRLVELARALAGPFDLLLLDEPSSGLDGHETAEFGQVLRTVVNERGYGILLVEHDMSLVREVCDYVYVLDFGSLIFEGTPEEMLQSDAVRAAYLGDAAGLREGASRTDGGNEPLVAGK